MKPTLAEMLAVLVDSAIESNSIRTGNYPESVTAIALQIQAEFGAITYCESLHGLDPFNTAYAPRNGRKLDMFQCGAVGTLAHTAAMIALTGN